MKITLNVLKSLTKRKKIVCSAYTSDLNTTSVACPSGCHLQVETPQRVPAVEIGLAARPFFSPLVAGFKTKRFFDLCKLIILKKIDVRSFQKLFPLPARILNSIIVAWENSREATSKKELMASIFNHVRLLSDFVVRLHIYYAFWISTNNTSSAEETFNQYTSLFWKNSRLSCMFILCHQTGLEALKEQMRREGNSEYLYFLLLVSEYEAMPDTLRFQCAKQIVQLFLTDKSDHRIAISTTVSTKIFERLSDYGDLIPSTVFQEAQKEIFCYIQKEPFSRFTKSDKLLHVVRTQIFKEVQQSVEVSEVQMKLRKFDECSGNLSASYG